MIFKVSLKKIIMKKLLCIALLIATSTYLVKSQETSPVEDAIKIIFENDQLVATEYNSAPGNPVCGSGKHSHKAHLTVLLTDMKAKLSTPDGKTQEAELPAGTTFWSEAETHWVVNTGDKAAKVLIIEPKDKH